MIPDLLTLSDVMGTGHHAAVSAGVRAGSTVAVVGDGAVGLCGVLAAHRLGAERIIAMSRHADRQAVARRFGATDIVEERGSDGVAKIEDLTDGVGVDAVLECVGTKVSMQQAIESARPAVESGSSACRPAERSSRSARCSARTSASSVASRRSGRTSGAARRGARRSAEAGCGLRPRDAAGRGRRGLPRHGRAARDQGSAPPLTHAERLCVALTTSRTPRRSASRTTAYRPTSSRAGRPSSTTDRLPRSRCDDHHRR